LSWELPVWDRFVYGRYVLTKISGNRAPQRQPRSRKNVHARFQFTWAFALKYTHVFDCTYVRLWYIHVRTRVFNIRALLRQSTRVFRFTSTCTCACLRVCLPNCYYRIFKYIRFQIHCQILFLLQLFLMFLRFRCIMDG